MSPEQQKQQTLHALLTILLRIAAQQPVLFVMEDLHWVDPTTLEFLSLLVDQGPTARILALLTCRPDFSPPWTGRSHLTQVTLPRLPRRQAAEMIARVAHRKTLPAEVVEQVVARTDGVPLFVEELTKMVLESGLLQEREERYELTGPLPPLAIPATLHDSLMARLDRLATVKGLAQLGATLGREFSYELLQAVTPWDEDTLRRGLQQLVAAEFLYQRGLPPQATYLFKHALIQEAAYQSLLRSTRQQYHQRIAQVLEARFPELCETQPELLAHHYTEASLPAQAISYWQRAGQRAIERSAHLEAIAHLSKGLEGLGTLPDTPERARQELGLQTTLGAVLSAARGFGDPARERAYVRALELCQQVGDPSQHFPVLWGFCQSHIQQGRLPAVHALAEQLMDLAQRAQDPALLLAAHETLGEALFWAGEVPRALEHFEQGVVLHHPQQHRALAFLYGVDCGVLCRGFAAWALSLLGYPHQALQRLGALLPLAQELEHPYSLATALLMAAWVHMVHRDGPATQACAEALIALATAQGFSEWLAGGSIQRGWALTAQGQEEVGMAQMRQGLAAVLAAGTEIMHPYLLALLAEAHGKSGQAQEGLTALTEALAAVHHTGERWWEAELYRLRGDLLLAQAFAQVDEAETCFHQALAVAHRQQAKSLELRAAMSLARLWQHQGKRTAARALLAPIYGWFTEGFDTADVQEARALLEELACRSVL